MVLIMLAIPSACTDNGTSDTNEEGPFVEVVRGIVLEVDAESLISLDALEVQDESGEIWRFEGRGKVVPGFTPSHLSEHKLMGLNVEVSFYREGEVLVLDGISD